MLLNSGMAALNVGTGGARSGAVRVASSLDGNVCSLDAIFLNQMLDGGFRIATRCKAPDHSTFHAGLLLYTGFILVAARASSKNVSAAQQFREVLRGGRVSWSAASGPRRRPPHAL